MYRIGFIDDDRDSYEDYRVRLARKDIEHLLGEEVYLKLWVKVKRDWQDKGHILLELGFDKSNLM